LLVLRFCLLYCYIEGYHKWSIQNLHDTVAPHRHPSYKLIASRVPMLLLGAALLATNADVLVPNLDGIIVAPFGFLVDAQFYGGTNSTLLAEQTWALLVWVDRLYVSPSLTPWTTFDLKKLATSSACWSAGCMLGSVAGNPAFSRKPRRIDSWAAVRVGTSPRGWSKQALASRPIDSWIVAWGASPLPQVPLKAMRAARIRCLYVCRAAIVGTVRLKSAAWSECCEWRQFGETLDVVVCPLPGNTEWGAGHLDLSVGGCAL